MKKYFYILISVIAMALTFTLSSCGNDDDEYQENIWYSAGFSKYEGNASEMEDIAIPFESELSKIGWTSSTYKTSGNLSTNDARIINACKTAEKSLSGKTFNAKFVYHITRYSTNHSEQTEIYKFSN